MITFFISILCFFFGVAAGFITINILHNRDNEGYTNEEKHSFYRIVRYRNNKFDCIWRNVIYDKRVADKECARLNNPNCGNEWRYGKYVVEKDY